MLLMHEIPCALAFALVRAGNNRLARIAMMAITTSSSINVKPRVRLRFDPILSICHRRLKIIGRA
jgi:hypothetical protein